MDNNVLKKALLKGIPLGLALAFLMPLVRVLIKGGTYMEHLTSVFGIASLICFPLAWVIYFCSDRNKPKDGEKK